MALIYNEDELVREAALLLTTTAMLVDTVVGDGAGIRALGLDPDSIEADRHFSETHHPDDLLDLERFDVWHCLRRVEAYVKRQLASENVKTDLMWMDAALGQAFSTETLEAFEKERESNPRDEIPGRWEEGAGDVEFGHFHRGILRTLSDLAKARLKVDLGEPLTMGDIALLLDIREATVVTNAHRKKFETYEEDNRRYCLPEAVLPWMVKNGYLPTQEFATPSVAQSSTELMEDVVFVPAARDGTWFSPDCRIGGRYTIGNRGEERRFTDYFAALEELIRFPTPRWRRRRKDGVTGIACGVRFERVRRAEITRVLASQANSN